jgi:hypothetical protein
MATVSEIKKALDALGVKYEPKALKADLEKKLARAEKKAAKEATVKLPRFEGGQVLKVLSAGHTKTHFHCQVQDGPQKVTKHVPRDLFV